MTNIIFIAICFLQCLSSVGRSQENPFVIPENTNVASALDQSTQYSLDMRNHVDLSDSSHLPSSPRIEGTFSFLFDPHTIFFTRTEVLNPSEERELIWEEKWPFNDPVELILFDDSGKIIARKNHFYELKSNKINIRLSFPPGKSTLIFRFKSGTLVKSLPHLWDSESYRINKNFELTYFGSCLTLLLALGVINFILFTVFKDKGYQALGLSTLCGAVTLLGWSGFIQMFTSANQHINIYIFNFFSLVTVLGIPEIIVHYIGIGNDRRLIRLWKATWRISMVCFVSSLFYSQALSSVVWSFVMLLVIGFALFLWAIGLIEHRKKTAIYIIAWSPFTIGYATVTAYLLQIFPRASISFDVLIIGGCISSTLAFWVLAVNFKQVKDHLMQLEIEKAHTERNLHELSIIQEAIIDRGNHFPDFEIFSHFQPAETAGGDWLLVTEDRTKKMIILAVGDVTGHGLASAMLSAFVSGSLSSIINSTIWDKRIIKEQLNHLVSTLNWILHKKEPNTKRLMSMSLFAVDRASGDGYVINCGHPSPLLVHSKGISPLGSHGNGTLMGLDENLQQSASPFQLSTGDSIILYSDGLMDMMRCKTASQMQHRIKKRIAFDRSAQDTLQDIMKNSLSTGTKVPRDDITLLVLKATGEMLNNEPVQFKQAV